MHQSTIAFRATKKTERLLGVSTIVVSQNGWFIMENPIFFGWFGGTTIFGNILAVFPNKEILQVTKWLPPLLQCLTSVPPGVFQATKHGRVSRILSKFYRLKRSQGFGRSHLQLRPVFQRSYRIPRRVRICQISIREFLIIPRKFGPWPMDPLFGKWSLWWKHEGLGGPKIIGVKGSSCFFVFFFRGFLILRRCNFKYWGLLRYQLSHTVDASEIPFPTTEIGCS